MSVLTQMLPELKRELAELHRDRAAQPSAHSCQPTGPQPPATGQVTAGPSRTLFLISVPLQHLFQMSLVSGLVNQLEEVEADEAVQLVPSGSLQPAAFKQE